MNDRKTLDQLTSDELDQLYADLDRYEEVVGELNEMNIGLARQAARAEAEGDELRDEISAAAGRLADVTRARDRSKWYRDDAERRVRVQRWRAERAEAAVERVRALADRWKRNGTSDLARYADIMLGELDAPAPVAGPAATQATEEQQ